jgi:hypothetical protein
LPTPPFWLAIQITCAMGLGSNIKFGV